MDRPNTSAEGSLLELVAGGKNDARPLLLAF